MPFIVANRLLLSILEWLHGKHYCKVEVLVYCFNFIVCNCDKAGSQSQTCDGDGKCVCKYGYEGQMCSACVHGFYQKRINKVQSLCSGITALY